MQASQVLKHRSRQTISVRTSLCARGIVMLKQERAFPKLLQESWKHRIVYNVIVLYAVALTFPFTGTKGPNPNREKQPQTIIPPPPNFTAGTMHSGR